MRININGWAYSHTTKGGRKVYKHESGHEAIETGPRGREPQPVKVLSPMGELIGASNSIHEEMARWTKQE